MQCNFLLIFYNFSGQNQAIRAKQEVCLGVNVSLRGGNVTYRQRLRACEQINYAYWFNLQGGNISVLVSYFGLPVSCDFFSLRGERIRLYHNYNSKSAAVWIKAQLLLFFYLFTTPWWQITLTGPAISLRLIYNVKMQQVCVCICGRLMHQAVRLLVQ